MTILYSKKFGKNYRKLISKMREKFKESRNLFIVDPFNSVLNNHPLHGEYAGCRSINITGDYRAIFYHESDDTVRFIAIGTHHELFGN
jgi:addiction module RelE/StbE family toxin